MINSIFSLFDPDAEESILRKNLLVLSITSLIAHNIALSPPLLPAPTSFFEILLSYFFSTGVKMTSGILCLILIYQMVLYCFKLIMQLVYFLREKIEKNITWLEATKAANEIISEMLETTVSEPTTMTESTDLHEKKIEQREALVRNLWSGLFLMNDCYKILKRLLPLAPVIFAIIKTFPQAVQIIHL